MVYDSFKWAVIVCLLLQQQVAHAGWRDWLDVLTTEGAKVAGTGELSESVIADGLREALSKGAQSAVQNLGREGGFLDNVDVKIPIPEHLQLVEKGLRAIGQDAVADRFEESMNRAAERAVPEAASVFGEAISQMTIDDAKQILNGGDNAATDYLRRTSSDELKSKFTPIVDEAMGRVGVTKRYQDLVGKGSFLGGVIPSDKLDLGSYVTDKALDGVFYMIGREEQLIRQDPAKRTTELLQKVFAR